MMEKIKKWAKQYFGESVSLRIRLLRIALVMGELTSINVTVFNAFVLKMEMGIVICCLLSSVLLAVVLYFSTKIAELNDLFGIGLFALNVFIFPLLFLIGGGIKSALPAWLLLGLTLVYVFLDGWRFYMVLVCTVIADITVYLICFLQPDAIKRLDSYQTEVLSSGLGVVFISFLIGSMFRLQARTYEQEKKISEQRRREIEEISDSKSLFFANMSHEIRTPINTIIGLNEMILRDYVSDEVAENAINIENASKILLSLINDILDLSKIESGKMEIVPAPYDTASMFSDLVNIIWVRANQKKLDFKIDIAEDIPSALCGDEVRIKQVLTNILTNAVKYTEKGSVTLTVTWERQNEDTMQLKIAVEDTGIGIRKENLEDLFTVFKRVDQEKTKKIEGTGLGLSISKQLVDMMGGTIKVDSIYQKGSCFTVELTQKIVDAAPMGSLQYVHKKDLQNRKRYQRSFEAPDARVLVVDDNEMNLMVARKLLRDTKVQVDLAASGKECLAKTKENHYHVILMDHVMPDMNGEETLKKLRNRQEGYCQKTPVIALTANVMTNALAWYQDKGFDGYLAKPIHGSLLEAELLKFLPRELVDNGEELSEDSGTPEITSLMFHNKKKKICVCAECVCDLPQEWIEQFEIKLMYCYVTTDEGRFIDTREIEAEELLEYLASGKEAKTTTASLEEYEAFFADRLMEAEQVLLITVAAGLNESYDYAIQAAKNFDNVTVLNSSHLSSGMGIMVLYAAKMAQDGAGMEEIVKTLEKLKDKVSTSFILQSTESMYQNGRVTKGVRDFSKALQTRPVLRMSRNKIVLSYMIMGRGEAASLKYVSRQLKNSRKIDDRILFITHAGLSLSQLERIKQEVLKHKQFQVVKCQRASATISSNCGVGTFGLLYMKK